MAAGDLVAGLTVWAVLVPEARAYAAIAGVSPVVGLYAAPPALVLLFEQAWHVITHLGDPQWRTVAVGLGSLAVVLVLRRVAPVVRGSLVAVLGGDRAGDALDLADKGVEIVGDIDSGLPAIGLPDGVAFADDLTAVTVPDRAVREPFRGGPGGGRDRRAHRAGRLRRPDRALPRGRTWPSWARCLARPT